MSKLINKNKPLLDGRYYISDTQYVINEITLPIQSKIIIDKDDAGYVTSYKFIGGIMNHEARFEYTRDHKLIKATFSSEDLCFTETYPDERKCGDLFVREENGVRSYYYMNRIIASLDPDDVVEISYDNKRNIKNIKCDSAIKTFIYDNHSYFEIIENPHRISLSEIINGTSRIINEYEIDKNGNGKFYIPPINDDDDENTAYLKNVLINYLKQK